MVRLYFYEIVVILVNKFYLGNYQLTVSNWCSLKFFILELFFKLSAENRHAYLQNNRQYSFQLITLLFSNKYNKILNYF